jgi:hypothetical protein
VRSPVFTAEDQLAALTAGSTGRHLVIAAQFAPVATSTAAFAVRYDRGLSALVAWPRR